MLSPFCNGNCIPADMFETSDWYQYPENLIATPRALYNWDLAGHNVRLRDDSKRLFVPSEQSIVKVIEAGNRGTPARVRPTCENVGKELRLIDS